MFLEDSSFEKNYLLKCHKTVTKKSSLLKCKYLCMHWCMQASVYACEHGVGTLTFLWAGCRYVNILTPHCLILNSLFLTIFSINSHTVSYCGWESVNPGNRGSQPVLPPSLCAHSWQQAELKLIHRPGLQGPEHSSFLF